MDKTIEDAGRSALSDFNFANTYARFNEREQRRETWSESVNRVMQMHREYLQGTLGQGYEDVEFELDQIERLYLDKRILGSQRSLQFGGKAVLDKHARSYNCTSCYLDHPNRWDQALYLLLCGAGVGYSVQTHHVNQLPSVRTSAEMIELPHLRFTIPDTIEGWAEALRALTDCYFGLSDYIPSFDYSEIRPAGAPIKSCGGKAPSAYPLRVMLNQFEQILVQAAGRQLSTVEASDLMCIVSDCVLAGGVRRAALIALFSPDDEGMIGYKSQDGWWNTHSYRARANISALIVRDDPKAEEYFERIFKATRAYGEPAVIWAEHTEVTYNPCVEIGMLPTLVHDPQGMVVENISKDLIDPARREHWRKQGYTFTTAFQFCNLCEIDASRWEDIEDALHAVRNAVYLGMIQASYTGTDDDYLAPTVTRDILERESLLGVSLTGICSAKAFARDPAVLKMLAEYAVQVSSDRWRDFGLQSAPARVTCVKPSGNASVLLGCSSGIHPEHARRYIRRIQAPKKSPIVQAFRDSNPHACVDSVWSAHGTDLCLEFAVSVDGEALTRDDLSATDFLDLVQTVQQNWVKYGTARPASAEGITHNVSNTCTVREDEWDDVKRTLLDSRESLGGVSLLSASGDYDYPQAPYQAVYSNLMICPEDPHASAKKQAISKWDRLKSNLVRVDYAQVTETEDQTSVMQTVACAGGVCEI